MPLSKSLWTSKTLNMRFFGDLHYFMKCTYKILCPVHITVISRREIGDFSPRNRREIRTVHTTMISRRFLGDARYRRENKWTNRSSRDQSCDWPWHMWILDNGRPPMKKTNRLYSHEFVVTCRIDCMWATDSYRYVYTWKLSPVENDDCGWGAIIYV